MTEQTLDLSSDIRHKKAMSKISGRDTFLKHCPVSRETLERLAKYAQMLETWQQKINLVSGTTLPNVWTRHLLDSAQLFSYLPAGLERLVDLGSGAGFPGLVLAIMGVPEVHLIESDQRKAVFLREVSRETSAGVTVHAARIEDVPSLKADVITARALAPLSRLIPLAYYHLKQENGTCLFLKGVEMNMEIEDAAHTFDFAAETFQSVTSPTGAIVRLTQIHEK